jgi:hypothetical protein
MPIRNRSRCRRAPTLRSPVAIGLAALVGLPACTTDTAEEQGTSAEPAALASASQPVTQRWSPWFPFRRGQDYGQRVVRTWQASTEPGTANSLLGGQSTWRYPRDGGMVDGVATNRPNESMPAVHAREGYTQRHVVDYVMNWWCSPQEVYSPGLRNCGVPRRADGRLGYLEVQSETPDSMFLELWGWGDAAGFRTNLVDSMCSDPQWRERAAKLTASMRSPLLWALPANAGLANTWAGPSICEVKMEDFSRPIARQRGFVTVAVRSQTKDEHGFDILEAVNTYYYQRDPTDTRKTLGGEPCMTQARIRELSYAIERDANGLVVREIPATRPPDGEHLYASCAWAVEHYFMRRIPDHDRLVNGFGAWQMAAQDWSHPMNWSRTWDRVGQNRFTVERCDLVGGVPVNCRAP